MCYCDMMPGSWCWEPAAADRMQVQELSRNELQFLNWLFAPFSRPILENTLHCIHFFCVWCKYTSSWSVRLLNKEEFELQNIKRCRITIYDIYVELTLSKEVNDTNLYKFAGWPDTKMQMSKLSKMYIRGNWRESSQITSASVPNSREDSL